MARIGRRTPINRWMGQEATRFAVLLNNPATAVSMSGPSSGANLVASADFNVGANGIITGTVRVTPADGGASGTFTPTFVDINTGSPTGTFTYTPASTGVKTISVTNNGSLGNPSNISYTSNSISGRAAGALLNILLGSG